MLASVNGGVIVTTPHPIDGGLRLDDIGAPFVVLDGAARVLEATPSAAALMARFQLASGMPAMLPASISMISLPFVLRM